MKLLSRLIQILSGVQTGAEQEIGRLEQFAHFCVHAGKSFVRNRCPVRAASLSYATLFALIPMLAVAGSLASKRRVPVTSGTLPTHGALFVGLLIGTIVIVGALTFFPALSLGPIVEHFLMHQGRLWS